MPKLSVSLTEASPVKRGFQLLPFSRYSPSAPIAKRLPLYDSGRPVVRSMIAPSEPSSFSAAVDLVILIPPNSSEAKVLKSNPRERLAPASDWLPPATFCASAPLRRTIWKSPPRPRTVIVRPSPLSRSIDTPGRRWIDSAKFASGKSAMSSAVIASMIWFEARLRLREFSSEARKPVTTTSPSCASAAASSCVAAGCAAVAGAAVCAAAALPQVVASASAANDAPVRRIEFAFFLIIMPLPLDGRRYALRRSRRYFAQ